MAAFEVQRRPRLELHQCPKMKLELVEEGPSAREEYQVNT